MLFPMGHLLATPGALEMIDGDELINALERHLRGDWGDVCDADRTENNRALKYGRRLLSAYHTAKDVKFWIITEADRSATTVLLPEEY